MGIGGRRNPVQKAPTLDPPKPLVGAPDRMKMRTGRSFCCAHEVNTHGERAPHITAAPFPFFVDCSFRRINLFHFNRYRHFGAVANV